MVCRGNLCDSSSLNTLLCLWYLWGIPPMGAAGIFLEWKMILPRKQSRVSFFRGRVLCQGTKVALCAFLAHNITVSSLGSIRPLFHSIFGCVAGKHDYARSAFL